MVTDREYLLKASKFLPTKASKIVASEMGHDGIYGGIHSKLQNIMQMKVNGLEQMESANDSLDAAGWS